MEQQGWRRVLPYLSDRVAALLSEVPDTLPIEELRLRAGQPLELCYAGRDRLLYAPGGRPGATAQDCEETLRRITENSLYAWEEELRRGFLTLPGGCRVGLAGRAVKEKQGVSRLVDVTGLCIRIARAVRGAAERAAPYLLDGQGELCSTLIVSAPGAGKTTLLRDLVRIASSGDQGLRPARVSVVDTRYELAGAVRGEPQFDLGPRTDVLSGCGKAEGARMMIAAMSPEIIVVDELAAPDEIAAMTEAAACGVRVLASTHSGNAALLRKRTSLRLLLASGLFERIVLLSRRRGPGTVEAVLDADWNEITTEELPCRRSLPS